MKTDKRPRGQSKAFTRAEVAQIDAILAREEGNRARRDRALFRVALDTMLRGSDIMRLRVSDVRPGRTQDLASDAFWFTQKKTGERICCNLSLEARCCLTAWIDCAGLRREELVFPICDRQFRTIVKGLAKMIKLDPKLYSGHSTRRTRAKLIYAQTKNLGALRVLLGHKSLAATAAYLGIEQEDANAVWATVTL